MNVEVDLLQFGPISNWSPKIGDMIFKDGIFVRWCAVVTGINNTKIAFRKSGNVHLLTSGEYDEKTMDVRKIKSASYGSYFVVSGGIYYV